MRARILLHGAPLYPGFFATLLVIVALAGALAVVARRRGALLACCLGVAGWALSLLLALHPETAAVGERALMVGFFVPAAFIHAASVAVGQPAWRWRLAYGVAAAFFVVGLAAPQLFLAAGGRSPGPLFAPMFGSAALMSAWPLFLLVRGLSATDGLGRERLAYLLLAGFLCMFGGGVNVLLLLASEPNPLGLSMSLAGTGLLAWVLQASSLPSFGRFVERSLRYSVLAALLSTAWLFAILVFWPGAEGAPSPWRSWASAAQLFVLVLVGQPLLRALRARLARRLFPGQGDLEGMAIALAESEARAEHAGRLAEIGALASAVAHEVRNPLGVMAASVRILERQGADPIQIGELRHQLSKAAGFADELLEYGRPAPLNRRSVDLGAAAELAASELRRALPLDPFPTFRVQGQAPPVLGDLSQIVRLLSILVENAALAVGPGGQVQVSVQPQGHGVALRVEDDGPGVPEALRPRVFQAFVSGRGREGPRPGTGLGLAIALGIAERHGGRLALCPEPSPLGGACFALWLPCDRPLPLAGP